MIKEKRPQSALRTIVPTGGVRNKSHTRSTEFKSKPYRNVTSSLPVWSEELLKTMEDET
jgi:hypothetical protein